MLLSFKIKPLEPGRHAPRPLICEMICVGHPVAKCYLDWSALPTLMVSRSTDLSTVHRHVALSLRHRSELLSTASQFIHPRRRQGSCSTQLVIVSGLHRLRCSRVDPFCRYLHLDGFGVFRRVGEWRRRAADASVAHRRRHHAGADRAAGRGRPAGQGAHPGGPPGAAIALTMLLSATVPARRWVSYDCIMLCPCQLGVEHFANRCHQCRCCRCGSRSCPAVPKTPLAILRCWQVPECQKPAELSRSV